MPATNPNANDSEDNTTGAEVHVLHGSVAPRSEHDPGDHDHYQKVLSKARSNAVTRLRRDNRAEYDALVTQYMADHGLDYTPPLTPAQRAEAKIRELASAHGIPVRLEPAETS
jgi:hypothetical protein